MSGGGKSLTEMLAALRDGGQADLASAMFELARLGIRDREAFRAVLGWCQPDIGSGSCEEGRARLVAAVARGSGWDSSAWPRFALAGRGASRGQAVEDLARAGASEALTEPQVIVDCSGLEVASAAWTSTVVQVLTAGRAPELVVLDQVSELVGFHAASEASRVGQGARFGVTLRADVIEARR